MMRVNELVMRNIMNTVKRQTELRQELLQHHLTVLQPALNGESSTSPAGFAKAQLEHNLHRMERMVTEMRRVTDEITQCFNESMKVLFEDKQSDIHEAAAFTGSSVSKGLIG